MADYLGMMLRMRTGNKRDRDFRILFYFMNQFPPSPEYTIKAVLRKFAEILPGHGGKWKKSSMRKILIILLGHLLVVELTYI
jgi:hypothetical protein